MAGRQISSVVILANPRKRDAGALCTRLADYFASRGVSCTVMMLDSSESDLRLKVPDCDLAISLGGDGTVLTCAWLLKGRGIPLLAVNLGNFGYIADTSTDEVERVLDDYTGGRSGVFSRMMLDVAVLRDGKQVFCSSSLNDVTVSAITHARMTRMDLYVNDTLAARLKGDGIIIATPTGSTAYSLSAGGPILDASLDAIIINPICPFAMSVRPLVVDKGAVVEMRLPAQNTEMALTCDGHEVFSVREGDIISMRTGKSRALFVENRARRFIEVLRDKLGWAGGFNA